jgi:serine/threonine protein phosphatase PrpC
LTRSLGDFTHKSVQKVPFHMQPIICLPDIREVERNGKEEFMVIACDGIWERYEADSAPLMSQFKTKLSRYGAKEVLENFFDENLAKGGVEAQGRDNMTAIMLEFLH